MDMPLTNAPEPKRRFIPSKWEAKKVVQLVRAIRRGWLKPGEEKKEVNMGPSLSIVIAGGHPTRD